MMLRGHLRNQLPVLAGALALIACLSLHQLAKPAWRETVQEEAFDLVLELDSRLRSRASEQSRIVLIDIDRRSIEAHGPWPWPREKIAGMIDILAAAKPAAIAIDILFAEPDSRSPAALARRLGDVTGRPEISALASTLDDGDKRFAQAIGRAPTALGFVLDPGRKQGVPGIPVITRGSPNLAGIWRASGAGGPPSSLIEAVAGLGAISLPGDLDGTIRRVPILVAIGNTLRPGLAVEAVRLSQQASAYMLDGDRQRLVIGEHGTPVGNDGMLRLAPPASTPPTIISAFDLMSQDAATKAIAGAVVFVGGSAPELGGLRATASDALSPSVMIQARAAAQIMTGRSPQPFFTSRSATIGTIVLLSSAAIALGIALHPAVGAVAILAVIASTWMVASGLSLAADRLIDPLTPSLAAALTFVVTSVTAFAQTRRREALVRRRFEQHLAPAVVQRIVADPDAVKLRGERREVTSLFTDIEGFTSMTHRADPEALVALLDEYFEGIAAIVFAHGGMIDKMVGDAIHALFNAPLDLAGHPQRAVDCAIAIRAWSAKHRETEAALALRLGRTRIGIETGVTVVGDVGIAAKLDYTAHGDAINAAARFEAANKDLGSTICVGPGAAVRCDPALFRTLGSIKVRGRDEFIPVVEPWPEQMSSENRQAYLEASRIMSTDKERAAVMFEEIAARAPSDPVPLRMAQRLREGG